MQTYSVCNLHFGYEINGFHFVTIGINFFVWSKQKAHFVEKIVNSRLGTPSDEQDLGYSFFNILFQSFPATVFW